jgi:hypothetical protein
MQTRALFFMGMCYRPSMSQFTFDPSPPVQGQPLTILWSGQTPCTIEIEWTPKAEPTSVFLVKGQTGAVVTVPADAITVVVTCNGDEGGDVVSPS